MGVVSGSVFSQCGMILLTSALVPALQPLLPDEEHLILRLPSPKQLVRTSLFFLHSFKGRGSPGLPSPPTLRAPTALIWCPIHASQSRH